MKGSLINVVLAVTLLFGFTSCATPATPAKAYMPISQVPNPQELAQITKSFEINEKVGIGFLGGTGIAVATVGGYMIGNPTPGNEDKALLIGGLTAGAGLGLALIQDFVINAGKARRINMAAREALLTAARQRHTEEDIDVVNISVEYVQRSGNTHLYNATGIVIKKEY
ncbi:MAG: hypothetical protein LBH43_15110 [Treponema sp.]|jgi:hypothetical protein|nr:hypothetical protein [Treponema sp.]